MYRNERYHIVKNISKYIILLFLLFGFLPGYSLPSVFRGLSVTEGLSDLVVNALYKDSIGYVWIGTGNSLERFDGTRLKHFLISGANEKSSESMLSPKWKATRYGWETAWDFGG